MNYEYHRKGSSIIKFQDKGDKFYIVIKGKVGVMIPKTFKRESMLVGSKESKFLDLLTEGKGAGSSSSSGLGSESESEAESPTCHAREGEEMKEKDPQVV